METRRKQNIFEMLKERKQSVQNSISKSLKNANEIKTFLDKSKLEAVDLYHKES